ncbi:MAG: hypothetical protein B7Z66_09685 [Chromatiales bacterium 21-64-14]|nr:MAG: hypothetical protein B7Z66_09685 [Chromatiales bacterium 21-64-14]HQU16304.1 HAD-IA family hydrolase [Gammaproteobacteria bacterium]
MPTKRYRLLVFDWDGTLMDSVGHIVASMHAAMADLNVPRLPEAQVQDVIGLGLREALDTLFPDRDGEFKDRFTARYRAHFVTPGRVPPLFPDAELVLEALDAAGYLLAVATGKSRQGLLRELHGTGLERRFHASRCAEETCSKPDPRMLLEIMAELGVDPGATLMIGDTEYDMAMARNAGAHGLGITHGVHSAERLLRHGPTGCIDALSQFPKWLAQAGSVADTGARSGPAQRGG